MKKRTLKQKGEHMQLPQRPPVDRRRLKIICAFNDENIKNEWLLVDHADELIQRGHWVKIVQSSDSLAMMIREASARYNTPFDVVLTDYYLPAIVSGEQAFFSIDGIDRISSNNDVPICGVFCPESEAASETFVASPESIYVVSRRFWLPNGNRDVVGFLEHLLEQWQAWQTKLWEYELEEGPEPDFPDPPPPWQ